MIDLAAYFEIRSKILPGDLIAFSGRTAISRIIQVFTHSPVTHCAVVRQGMHDDGGPTDVMVTESTINDHHDGPQSNSIIDILTNDYSPGSQAAWLPLNPDVRNLIDWMRFYAFIGGIEDHAKYDKQGLVLFASKFLPFAGPFIPQHEDPSQFFCDSYAIAIYEACGVLRGINWREVSPQRLCEMKLYDRCVPIYGKPLKIKNFNTL